MKHFSIIIVLAVLFALALNFNAVFPQIQFQNQSKIFTDPNIELYNQFRNVNTFVPYDSTVLDSIIIAKMNQHHYPGLQACVVKDDQLIWKGAFGYANIAQNRLVTDSTLFFLASISKTVVATALMQLWEQGLFNLDDDVNNYLLFQVRNPNHPNVPITFRMLLTHTSSINDNGSILNPLFVWGQDSPIALDSFLVNYLVPGGLYYSSNNYSSSPGGQYNYSNVGAALVGHLVETISTYSLEQYCQDSIFVPLGMNEISWFLANLNPNHIAMPYSGNYPYGHSGIPHYPAGQLRTSTVQLSRYLRAYIQWGQFNGFRLLDSATVALMTTVHIPNASPQFSQYGLLWGITGFPIPNIGTRIIYGHGGVSHGARAQMWYIAGIEKNVGAIAFANGESDYGIVEIGSELFAYGLLYDEIYAHHTELNSNFMQPNEDTLIINTKFFNPNNHNFSANALITSIDSVYNDSIPLFDDGNHGDLQAGDGIWGNFITPLSFENEFMIGISTTDLDFGDYFVLYNLSRFTTIGPVQFENFVEFGVYDTPPYCFTKLTLRNHGLISPAKSIKAQLVPLDSSNLIKITDNLQSFGQINAGESRVSANWYYIYMDSLTELIEIPFQINIYCADHHFWTDTAHLNIVTGIKELSSTIPKQYALYPNYPNPFNPTTTIEFDLPKTSNVTLKVFNILGEEVAILVSGSLTAGSYSYDWEASNLASGVYLYRLEAGEYVETRKMVLMR